MPRFGSIFLFVLMLPLAIAAQESKRLPEPDARYKTDILVVVAHPDDEGAATPYLARAMAQGKHVAVVFGTRGNSGANEVGEEQAAALGAVREIEARRGLSTLGITNVWFLDGKDTASQNVLQSLSTWNHGVCLQQLVRLVRLTRPEVILTFLPGTFIGEDHGDHQAAGVLATEAFDLAGNAVVFPEQLAGPTKRLEALFDNLRPWQTKKIYYFADAAKEDIFHGQGPQYSVKEFPKSSKQPYWRMALEEFRAHETQAKSFFDTLRKMDEAQIEKMVTSEGVWTDSLYFVRGKSLVGGSVTGDVFEGIAPGAIPAVRPEAGSEPPLPELSAQLAGPWNYYADFRRAHGITHLPHPEPPEIALQAGTTLVIPLWLNNQTPTAQQITLSVSAPDGWTVASGAGQFTVGPKQVAAARVEVTLPVSGEALLKNAEPQEVTVQAEANGRSIGVATLRVALRKRALPQ
ncbi:MAG TPA: PIG-L family deacetylase [Candidatus Dormibacteraeota bacterium]|nr:PIG-L family deacetylase [Candidatus Dormibacteraeota bacterium]